MSDAYIEYTNTNDDGLEYVDSITFADLERHKNCINWWKISENITAETCTEDFYSRFDPYLNWRNGKFLAYVSEEYLMKKIDQISPSALFELNVELSEDFCIDLLKREYNNWEYYSRLSKMLSTQKNLSSDFLDAYVFKEFTSTDDSRRNRGYYSLSSIARAITFHQKITEGQFLDYIYNDTKYFTKFFKFVILSSAENNYSKEFIMKHKRNLNEKSFFNTDQVKEHLSQTRISDAALEIFKSKINWVDIVNYTNDIENIRYMVPTCKKELFDVFIKFSDQIKKPEKLAKFGELFS